MISGFSEREVQQALADHWHPKPAPTLRWLFILFSLESGVEFFAVVNEQGGREYSINGRAVFAVHEHTPFAQAFRGMPPGDFSRFQDTTYLSVGRCPDILPSPLECTAALELGAALREEVHGMAARQDRLALALQERRVRLEEDGDTVRRAKRCHVYLFEQGRWIAEEDRDRERSAQTLSDLRSAPLARQIGGLQSCYAYELERLGRLEVEVAEALDREQERQGPLRKRRPGVLLADEHDRAERQRHRGR